MTDAQFERLIIAIDRVGSAIEKQTEAMQAGRVQDEESWEAKRDKIFEMLQSFANAAAMTIPTGIFPSKKS